MRSVFGCCCVSATGRSPVQPLTLLFFAAALSRLHHVHHGSHHHHHDLGSTRVVGSMKLQRQGIGQGRRRRRVRRGQRRRATDSTGGGIGRKVAARKEGCGKRTGLVKEMSSGDVLDLDACLAVAVEAAHAAGDLIRRRFTEQQQQRWRMHAGDTEPEGGMIPGEVDFDIQMKKGPADLVTATDKECETIIAEKIRTRFPTHAFIGEEESSAASKNVTSSPDPLHDRTPTWMVDPLDGTTNFVHSFPFSCVSICLAVLGEPVVGVVHNPVLEETFTAVTNGGCYVNMKRSSGDGRGVRCYVNKSTIDMGKALFATEIGVSRDSPTLDSMVARIRALINSTRSVRCSGSCAMNLAGVASGRLDGFYEIDFGGCWDVAAGALLVKEAGGIVIDPFDVQNEKMEKADKGKAKYDLMCRRVVAAATPQLAEECARIIRENTKSSTYK